MKCLREEGENAFGLTVYVQPKASRNSVAGEHGSALKIRITASPVDGKANTALIALLAKLFRLPKSAVTLAAGRQSRTKHFHITGLSVAAAADVLQQRLAAR